MGEGSWRNHRIHREPFNALQHRPIPYCSLGVVQNSPVNTWDSRHIKPKSVLFVAIATTSRRCREFKDRRDPPLNYNMEWWKVKRWPNSDLVVVVNDNPTPRPTDDPHFLKILRVPTIAREVRTILWFSFRFTCDSSSLCVHGIIFAG